MTAPHASTSPATATDMLRRQMQVITCPACGHHVAVPFYDGGQQPLTTLAWPASTAEAEAMRRLPLDFVRCVDCGHVYNQGFDYREVPYSDKPNLMFNRGSAWQHHLQRVAELILAAAGTSPRVVEIGCGDGHLLRRLAAISPQGSYIGFDPHALEPETPSGESTQPQIYRNLFDPAVDLARYEPGIIVSRHVLEHLSNPLGFLQQMAFAATYHGADVRVFIEVPCIDRALATGRTTDFFYEHNSHFTSHSFERMLQRCGATIEHIELGYDAEVICGIAKLEPVGGSGRFASEALAFDELSRQRHSAIRQQVDHLANTQQRIAIWGGTGKAASFINRYGLDRNRFPLVVDSDLDKVGTCVPGTGQRIESPELLTTHPADQILIATQWRAVDIVQEIRQRQLRTKRILIEHEDRLVDFEHDDHPYRLANSPGQTAMLPAMSLRTDEGGLSSVPTQV